jgi:hypothetical protein
LSDAAQRQPKLLPILVPLATLAAIALAILALLMLRPKLGAWSSACLIVPPVMYAATAMSSDADEGIRYFLPVYPFLYVMVGIAAAKLVEWRPRLAWSAIAVLGAGLMCETLAAFPHYISFFNATARADRLCLLGVRISIGGRIWLTSRNGSGNIGA